MHARVQPISQAAPPAANDPAPKLAVVIPSFRAAAAIGAVLSGIGPGVAAIYVVDDCCPDNSGEQALRDCADPRLIVLHNASNLGVGGAVKHGYRRALADGAEIVVKLDADDQMDPAQIARLVAPIAAGRADYAKGDRFAPRRLMPADSDPEALAAMPPQRRLANRALSALHRPATGYWHVRDPANGFTAIHAGALRRIDLDLVSDCFFFETDMLFRLGLAGAIVADVPLPARYSGAPSNVRLGRLAPRFARLVAQRLVQRRLERLRARLRPGRSAVLSGQPLWCQSPPS